MAAWIWGFCLSRAGLPLTRQRLHHWFSVGGDDARPEWMSVTLVHLHRLAAAVLGPSVLWWYKRMTALPPFWGFLSLG